MLRIRDKFIPPKTRARDGHFIRAFLISMTPRSSSTMTVGLTCSTAQVR